MQKSIITLSTFLAIICILSVDASAQRMGVKKHLGFDFNNNADEITRYYYGLGADVIREEIQFQKTYNAHESVEVHLLSFAHTPLFLSVATEYINIGFINGRIEVITIITMDDKCVDIMDHKLHKYSAGNVAVNKLNGIKKIQWSFDDCAVIKEVVSPIGDSSRYYKYDIVPNTED